MLDMVRRNCYSVIVLVISLYILRTILLSVFNQLWVDRCVIVLTEVFGITTSGLGYKGYRLSILTKHEAEWIKPSTHITPHFTLTFPALSVAPACGGDTACNKLLGPPQIHAGSANDSPENKNQQSFLKDHNNEIGFFYTDKTSTTMCENNI